MILVKQKKPNECSLACLTMVIGKEYEEVRSKLPDRAKKDLKNNEGMYYSDTITTLENFGLDWDFISLEEDEIFPLNEITTAILTVPSKNKEGTLHAIVYDSGIILDPSVNKTYNNIEDTIDHIIDYIIVKG